MRKIITILFMVMLALAACDDGGAYRNPTSAPTPTSEGGVPATVSASDNNIRVPVVRITDGDTIQVEINGEWVYVRYIGMNTPEIAHSASETDQPCGQDAAEANRRLVEGQVVRLEKDVSDTDRYGRLLRYVYLGDTFVNAALVREGWAEVVSYPPDTREFENFRALEQEAEAAGRGCHPTGIFVDDSYER